MRAPADLDDAEIAIACASHLARPEQLDAVRTLLVKAEADRGRPRVWPGADEARAQLLGKARRPARAVPCHGWPIEGYRLPEHPCQQALLDEIARAAEVDPESMPTAADGCGILTFALTLERMAHAFSRLDQLEGASRISAAMRAHPDLIRGPQAADTVLMRTQPGWVAKGGAEGLLCAASADGLGVALKIEDGSQRAIRPRQRSSSRRSGSTPASSDMSRSRTPAAR